MTTTAADAGRFNNNLTLYRISRHNKCMGFLQDSKTVQFLCHNTLSSKGYIFSISWCPVPGYRLPEAGQPAGIHV
jgi:hypothetical protein